LALNVLICGVRPFNWIAEALKVDKQQKVRLPMLSLHLARSQKILLSLRKQNHLQLELEKKAIAAKPLIVILFLFSVKVEHKKGPGVEKKYKHWQKLPTELKVRSYC
jgi:hypothetical protein